jgi:hypothetical protein
VTVAVTVTADEPRTFYGTSSGTSAIDATARATLDALNRQIARLLPND